MNSADRKPLPGTSLTYFDAQAAVERIQAGALFVELGKIQGCLPVRWWIK